jgi:hypothetical protein
LDMQKRTYCNKICDKTLYLPGLWLFVLFCRSGNALSIQFFLFGLWRFVLFCITGFRYVYPFIYPVCDVLECFVTQVCNLFVPFHLTGLWLLYCCIYPVGYDL